MAGLLVFIYTHLDYSSKVASAEAIMDDFPG